MKILSYTPEITFDDVLLLPGKSEVSMHDSESIISTASKLSKHITLDFPVVAAPMPNVTESEMAIEIGKAGGIGFIHFFMSYEQQIKEVRDCKKAGVKVGAAIWDLSETGIKHIENLVKAGVDIVSIESYHAYNTDFLNFIKKVKKTFKKLDICAGYFATPEGVKACIEAGADSIRVGIGGGSHCTTRLVTGVGRPQLSTVLECSKIAKKYGVPLMSDTGIKYAGDIAKALAFGADTVMIGGLLSGTFESPGEVVTKNGKKFKYSSGMCSKEANVQKTSFYNKFYKAAKKSIKTMIGRREKELVQNRFLEEGISGLIPYKGAVAPILNDLKGGLVRSMWYQGVNTVQELQKEAKVVIVSGNTPIENAPRI